MGLRRDNVPENIRRRMSAADRKKYGLLPEEVLAENIVREEKTLHKQIFALLRRREVPYVHAAMFKKSQLPPGWPDFTFLYRGVGLGWECKVGRGKLSPHQIARHEVMRNQGWRISEIRSLDEAQRILDALDEA